MNFDDAVRLTEILLGFALVQQSIEHLNSIGSEKWLFIPRLVLAILLMFGYEPAWVTMLLLLLSIGILHRFQGPYNGGADRMSLLLLICLCLTHFVTNEYWQEVAFGYIALQLILSYFMSGWVKIINPDWRSGRALCDVFLFSAYPVSESLRSWTDSPRMLHVMSWSVILFEVLFPLSLISAISLNVALVIAACFHLSNACLFGLNRFFWVWISAYPSLIWLQQYF